MVTITKVATSGYGFGANGSSCIHVDAELDGDEYVFDRVSRRKTWDLPLSDDKVHPVTFQLRRGKKLSAMYKPNIVFSTTPTDKWALRPINELVGYVMQLGKELENLAAQLEPLVKHEIILNEWSKKNDITVEAAFDSHPEGAVSLYVTARVGWSYEHVPNERESKLMWKEPKGYNQRLVESSKGFSHSASVTHKFTKAEYLALTEAAVDALCQETLTILEAGAAIKKANVIARLKNTDDVTFYPTGIKYDGEIEETSVSIALSDRSTATRIEFETPMKMLDYMESVTVEDIKKQYEFKPRPRQSTYSEEERLERSEERKKIAESKKSLETQWKAIREQAKVWSAKEESK